jgi:hypothetical protein
MCDSLCQDCQWTFGLIFFFVILCIIEVGNHIVLHWCVNCHVLIEPFDFIEIFLLAWIGEKLLPMVLKQNGISSLHDRKRRVR